MSVNRERLRATRRGAGGDPPAPHQLEQPEQLDQLDRLSQLRERSELGALPSPSSDEPAPVVAARPSPPPVTRHVSDHVAAHDDELVGEAHTVRPYAVTGGRTRSSSTPLPVEALVQATAAADPTLVGLPFECRTILELTAGTYLSVAELSAHTHLPVGVIRVLVSDLADEGKVTVHGLPSSTSDNPATSLSVLESVLNGISSL